MSPHTQFPLTQFWPEAQTWPQAPQLKRSERMLVSQPSKLKPLQLANPALHWRAHWLLMQTGVAFAPPGQLEGTHCVLAACAGAGAAIVATRAAAEANPKRASSLIASRREPADRFLGWLTRRFASSSSWRA